MAFTTMFRLQSDRLGPIGTFKRIYNFDAPVSTFGGGQKVDVMLLQALFRLFYYQFDGSVPIPSASTGVIAVDGIAGRQTRLHIEHYQQHLKLRGDSDTTDGVMDPFKKQGVNTTRTNRHYQLEILNADVLKLAIANNAEFVHQNITEPNPVSNDIPPPLRNALRVVRSL